MFRKVFYVKLCELHVYDTVNFETCCEKLETSNNLNKEETFKFNSTTDL